MREAERSEAEEVERFRRLDELFEHVSALPADQQAARLDAECADDPALRAEVAALLDVDDSAETLLGGVIEAGLGWLSDGPPPPERLGPYRVVEEIGRGGLGTVYLAERDDAEFQMQVAIKVVRPEVRTPELEHRLLRERQILAGLEHPNIAHILDGGTTEDGAPFLVMERIEGEPITSHCRRHGLSIRDQLELFRAVCDAVHYAHRNLVLHRDLKPSNILVTDGGVPKLLDFGIAKVLHGDTPAVFATDTPTLTRPGTRLLTPEYASPEQVLGRPLTTASDVYSLGVLLFELLTGERPYRIDDPRPSEIERVVCGVEPERPRDVLWRRDERPLWGEDLDTIVAMALRKEPERRYASVEQLAEDLRRYSGDLPVLARRDSLGYRTTKFFRRHRVPVVAAALVLTTLLTAVVVTTFQARVAEHESERAEMVADFLVDLFEISDPSRSRGATVTAREVLDQGARRLGWQLRDRPLLRTTLMTTIGRVYRQLGLLDASDELLTEALDVRRRDLPEGAPDVVIGLRELGLLRWEQGALDESEALLREALSIERRHRGDSPSSSEILQDLAALLGERGDSAARGLLDEALAIRLRAHGEASIEVAETRDRLAQVLYKTGALTEAERLARMALASRRAAWGDDHPDIARSLNNLAAILQANGEREAAAELFEQALAQRRRLYGDRHGAVVQSLSNAATSHATLGEWAEAEKRFAEALETATAVYGEDHIMVADILYNSARLHRVRGDVASSLEDHRRALDIRRRQLREAHPEIIQSLVALGNALREIDPAAAEAHYRDALTLQRRHLAADDARRASTLIRLGRFLCPSEPNEAIALLDEAWQLRRRVLGERRWETALAEGYLGRCLAGVDTERARARLLAAFEMLDASVGADDPRAEKVRRWLADLEAEPPEQAADGPG